MSRSQKRAVVRGSLLLDLVTRDLLSDRQKAAALMLERDREQASGVSASICAYGASTGGGGARARAPIARESFASQSWEALKRSLAPTDRQLLGKIESTNSTRRGSLAALPVKTGLADAKDDSLVKRGMIAMFLERVADHYRLPEEA